MGYVSTFRSIERIWVKELEAMRGYEGVEGILGQERLLCMYDTDAIRGTRFTIVSYIQINAPGGRMDTVRKRIALLFVLLRRVLSTYEQVTVTSASNADWQELGVSKRRLGISRGWQRN